MNGLFLEYANLKPVAVPADMNGAAVTGARVSLGENERATIVINMGDSTAAVTTFTLQQHDAATAGNSKNLEVTNAYFHKVAAATSFTKVVPNSATAVYDVASLFADDEGVLVFEVEAQDLDLDNGFTHISINSADSTAAKIMSAVYVLAEPKHKPAYERAI